MATYKDIQRLTGLSLSTISKYFNELPVREANRVAIEAAVEQLGFRRNAFARGLRTRRSQVVGVLLPELNNPFLMGIVAGIERELQAAGVGLLVRATHDDPVAGVLALRDRMVDGILMVPAADIAADALVGAAGDIPIILVDRELDGLAFDSVTIDNEQAAATAAQCLIAFGHERLAAIVGPSRIWTMRRRAAGFVEACQAAGLPDPVVVEADELAVPAGYAAMSRLLASSPRPSGVLCANDALTLGALTAIGNAGLAIPGDVSLIGFDSADLAQVTKPRLWTLVQPLDDMAREAAARMLEWLAGAGETGREIVLRAQLAPGDSVGAPPPRPGRRDSLQGADRSAPES
ncbi:MAG: LacI family DNA-binding transcriptional regulator [Arachnia sp.]